MKTRKTIILLSFMLVALYNIQAQDFLPMLNDNYMGINQVVLQPASIADSKFKIDINIVSINGDLYNDFIQFKREGIINPLGIITNKNWWDDYSFLTKHSDEARNAFFNLTVMGPGFMISLPKDFAIGFTSKLRNIINIDGIGDALGRSIYEDFAYKPAWNIWHHDKDIRFIHHLYADYGLTVARKLYSDNNHQIKGGITVKLLQGLGASYMQIDDFYYMIHQPNSSASKADYVSWNTPYAYLGFSDNWGHYNTSGDFEFDWKYKFISKPSLGLDIGAVYEFRKNSGEAGNKTAENSYNEASGANKYFLKVGVSVIDIGKLRYDRFYSNDFKIASTPDYKSRYDNGDNSIPNNTYWMNIRDVSFDFPPYYLFYDTLTLRESSIKGVEFNKKSSEKFDIQLPTAFSLQVDVNPYKCFYVNLTTYTALHQTYGNTSNSHYISTYSLTPRIEQQWYSVMLPLTVNQYGKLNLGLGVRASYVYFGINNIFSGLLNNTFGTNFYLGAKIPIWYSKDNNGGCK